MSERETHKLEPHDLRFAEGKREADKCRECGQAIWRVYHGPNRNHTIERRAVAAYLDSLLEGLPEPAVAAMMESGGRGSTNTTRELCERWLEAALRSLRTGLEGEHGD